MTTGTVVVTTTTSSTGTASGVATIWTDQADYAPVDTPIIYGSGFLPNANITVSVARPEGTVNTWLTVSDGSGGFQTSYATDGLVVGTFTVTATDGTNAATTTFTDTTNVDTTTSLTISSPQTSGATVSFSGTVTSQDSSNPYIHNGDTMTLTQYSGSLCHGSGTDVATASTSGGNGGYSGTFTAPTVTSSTAYSYTASFPGYTQGSGNSAITWRKSTSSCASVTVNPVPTTYSVTFQQIGIPSGVTWGVTVTGFGDHTTTASSISVTGLSGTPTYTYDTPVAGTTGTQYVCSGGTCTGSVSSSTGSVSATYVTQYFLTVNSAYDTAGGAGWYASGSTAYATLSTGTVSGGTGIQYVFTSWGGDASGSGLTSNAITMSSPKTATATWQTQYLVHYAQIGCDAAVTITLPADTFFVSGALHATLVAGAFPSPVLSGDLKTKCVFQSDDGPSTLTGPVTITATYLTQYLVHYVATGCVLSVTVPGDEWVNSGSGATGTFLLQVVNGAGDTRCNFVTDNRPTVPPGVTGPTIVTGSYQTQYLQTFDASSNVKSDGSGTIVSVTVDGNAPVNCVRTDLPASTNCEFWVNENVQVNFAYTSTVGSVGDPAGTRYVLTSVTNLPGSLPYTVSSANTFTGNYQTQYDLKFDQSGLDNTAEGTVVSVTKGANPAVTVVFSDFTKDFGFIDASTQISYAFTVTVASSTTGKQFVLTTPAPAPSSGFLLSAPTTVLGTYKTQWQVTFAQTGVGTDFTGAVLVLDGTNYCVITGSTCSSGSNVLPQSFWLDANSQHNFAFQSPLAVSSTNQYVWISTTGGLSSAQSDIAFTVTGAGSIVGSYLTQYQVTASYSTSDGSNPSSNVILSGTSVGLPSTTTLTTSTQQVWLDAATSWSVNNPIVAVSGTERWDASSGTSGTVGSTTTIAPLYYHQFQVTLQYVVANSPAGTPTDPTATYTKFGVSGTTSTATQSSPPSDWVDAGSSVTYTNPIVGATGERWKVSPEGSADPFVADSSVAASETLDPSYYHQYLMTLSYSVSDVSTPSPLPTFTANRFGSPATETLMTTATGYWFDVGASWAVDNPIPASPTTERWMLALSQSASGTVSVTTIVFAYFHQYLMTLSYSVSDGSTLSPAPLFTANQFGVSHAVTLTLSPTTVSDWFDCEYFGDCLFCD